MLPPVGGLDGQGQGRVHPTGQPEHRPAEATLADVIPNPEHQGAVDAAHRARLQLAHQAGMGAQAAGDDHHAGSVLVQPVHDPRAGQRGQRLIEMQQRVLQRAVRVARRRMHHQARRLVDDDQVVVGVEDIQRNRFRPHLVVTLDLRREFQMLAAEQPVGRLADPTVHGQLATADPLLKSRPREIRKQLGRRLVQAQPGVFRGRGRAQFDMFGGTRHGGHSPIIMSSCPSSHFADHK